MNSPQNKILSLLTTVVAEDSDYYRIIPATTEQITAFLEMALERGVDDSVVNQLVDLYQVANNFCYEIILEFHNCDDVILFEWWGEKEIWLGQRDFHTLR